MFNLSSTHQVVLVLCTFAACKRDAATEAPKASPAPPPVAAPIEKAPTPAPTEAAKPAADVSANAAPVTARIPAELVGRWIYTDRDSQEGETAFALDASGVFAWMYSPMHDGGCEIVGYATATANKLSVETSRDTCRELPMRTWTVKAVNKNTLTLVERGSPARTFTRSTGGHPATTDITMELTPTRDDPRYKGAAILTASAPLEFPAEVATAARMAVYPAVLSADGKALAYLYVTQDAPMQLRVFRPGHAPKTLVTFDEENDGSPRMAWSPDGKRLALIELRLAVGSRDWRHPTSRLTVLDLSSDDEVTARFQAQITPYFNIGENDLEVPVWKDATTIQYESMDDGRRGPTLEVAVK